MTFHSSSGDERAAYQDESNMITRVCRRTLVLMTSVVLTGVFLTGCGGSPDPASPPAPKDSRPTTEEGQSLPPPSDK